MLCLELITFKYYCHSFYAQSKQVGTLQKKNGHLQSTVSAVERTAQHQLHSLANHSEVAIDTAQTRLVDANGRIQEYNKFAKVTYFSLLYIYTDMCLLIKSICTHTAAKELTNIIV